MSWLAVAVLLGSGVGVAQPSRDRAQIQRALVAEALRGDVPGAISRYQQLVRTLPDEDPQWAEAVLRWARALYDEGRTRDAREALRMATRKAKCDASCQGLLQHIAIDQESVDTTPVQWRFDNGNPGLFHLWSRQDAGELLARPGALSWTTTAEPRRTDRLVVGFVRPDPAPSLVAFTLRSIDTISWVRVVLEDEAGHRFVTPIVPLQPNADTRIVAVLEEVVAVDPTTRLDPARLSRASLEDLTGMRRSGAHTLEIVAFETEL